MEQRRYNILHRRKVDIVIPTVEKDISACDMPKDPQGVTRIPPIDSESSNHLQTNSAVAEPTEGWGKTVFHPKTADGITRKPRVRAELCPVQTWTQ